MDTSVTPATSATASVRTTWALCASHICHTAKGEAADALHICHAAGVRVTDGYLRRAPATRVARGRARYTNVTTRPAGARARYVRVTPGSHGQHFCGCQAGRER
eukprot:1304868-Pyramimonas_sp.AAC.1